MVKRRERVVVLLDTNVLVRALANPNNQSAANRIIDKDLLELPWDERRRFNFQIVTPTDFLKQVE